MSLLLEKSSVFYIFLGKSLVFCVFQNVCWSVSLLSGLEPGFQAFWETQCIELTGWSSLWPGWSLPEVKGWWGAGRHWGCGFSHRMFLPLLGSAKWAGGKALSSLKVQMKWGIRMFIEPEGSLKCLQACGIPEMFKGGMKKTKKPKLGDLNLNISKPQAC